jgi:NCAIR mutase (PurE)-related protein
MRNLQRAGGHLDAKKLRELLDDVGAGKVSTEAAMEALAFLPYEDIGHARIDHHRHLRTGVPEVILSQGKSLEQVAEIAEAMLRAGSRVIITRVDGNRAAQLGRAFPAAAQYPTARIVAIDAAPLDRVPGVAVLSAGTSDIPVAEEAAITAELMGNEVERYFDVGVAGLHRLLAVAPRLQKLRAAVVVAGMDGALPSVTAGLVSCPVVAVPTSTGYGAAFNGLAPLLTMLNSCAPGVSVVNIDNGFGAGVVASMINRCRSE